MFQYSDLTHSENYIDEDKGDSVESPSHYNQGSIQCIVYLRDNMPFETYLGYLEGNTKKYLHRFRYKQKPLEDLKKAHWYLSRLIKELEIESEDKYEDIYGDENEYE